MNHFYGVQIEQQKGQEPSGKVAYGQHGRRNGRPGIEQNQAQHEGSPAEQADNGKIRPRPAARLTAKP